MWKRHRRGLSSTVQHGIVIVGLASVSGANFRRVVEISEKKGADRLTFVDLMSNPASPIALPTLSRHETSLHEAL